MRYEDLKLEVDPTYAAKVTYDEAKQYILEGLEPLGRRLPQDYEGSLRQPLDRLR